MKSTIQDKVVFITGGANGIGRNLVSTFCKSGADVLFCDIDEKRGQELCAELSQYSCSFFKADISDSQALIHVMDAIFREKGNIDILINNGGVGLFKSILDVSVSDFDKILTTNLRSVFVTAKTLAKHREAHPELNQYGRVINIASTRYLMSEPNSEAYAASKGGVVSLTHALALSFSKYNITVNCISPGWIETGDYTVLKPTDHNQHPSGRVGQPDDISRLCLFLSEPENNFINGQNYIIDGGMTKKMIYQE